MRFGNPRGNNNDSFSAISALRALVCVCVCVWGGGGGCNLVRMDQSGIWLNLMGLVFGTLELNLIKLVSKERTILNANHHSKRHLGYLSENFLVNNCGMYGLS